LPDYDYQRHFGGVFYLFLRGMDGSSPDNGIFATRPAEAFVEEIDALFGETGEML
jgi:exodeoxyribonuclease V beta subunit